MECRGNYIGFESGCTTCPMNFNAELDCEGCSLRWAEPDCLTCKMNFKGDDCSECADNWTGTNCAECAESYYGDACESYCMNGDIVENECICHPGFAVQVGNPFCMLIECYIGCELCVDDSELPLCLSCSEGFRWIAPSADDLDYQGFHICGAQCPSGFVESEGSRTCIREDKLVVA
jgi:hypothetical protein